MILTGGERRAPAIAALIKLGATEFVQKPLEAEQLKLACQKALKDARKARVAD